MCANDAAIPVLGVVCDAVIRIKCDVWTRIRMDIMYGDARATLADLRRGYEASLSPEPSK